MGVIQRQGIKSSLLNYFSIFIGALSIVFVYPQALAAYGLITFLTELAIFTSALAAWSLPTLMIKFFARFEDKNNNNNGFLAGAILANLLGFIIFAGLYVALRGYILAFYADKSDLEKSNIDYLLVFTFLLSWINLFNYYCALFQRLVISALADFLSKVARPLLIILYLSGYLSVTEIIQGLVLAYTGIILVLIMYIKRMGKLFLNLNFAHIDKKLGWEMLRYSGGATLLILFSTLGLQLDRITVSVYLDMQANGIYGMAQFISNLIAIPLVTLGGIIAPIVVKHFGENKRAEIQDLYQKSTELLAMVGAYIGLGIILCIDDLYQMTDNYSALAGSVSVVIGLVIAKILDNLGGISRWILEFSDKYHWGILFMGISVLINISLSIMLIPKYGLLGVAGANFGAVGFYTLARVGILYHFYQLWPLTLKIGYSLGLGIILYFVIDFINIQISPLWNILVKGALLTLLYLPAGYYLRLSGEYCGLVELIFIKVFKKNLKR